MIFHLVFLIAALICFILAAIGVSGKVNLVALGLACLTASMMVILRV
jgi:hypothetical protein